MVERTRTLNRRTFLGGAATFCVASFAVPSLAYATSSSELSQEAADLQSQADEVSQELINAQANLEAASEQYYKAQADHEAATQAAQEAQTKIDDATQQIQQVQTKLGTRARDMYRSGSSSFLDLLLGSTTFEEFATNWDLLSDMNEQDAALVQQTRIRQEIEDQKAELDKQEAAAAAAEQSAKDASDSAASTQMLQEKYATLTAAQQEKAQEAQAQAGASCCGCRRSTASCREQRRFQQ